MTAKPKKTVYSQGKPTTSRPSTPRSGRELYEAARGEEEEAQRQEIKDMEWPFGFSMNGGAEYSDGSDGPNTGLVYLMPHTDENGAINLSRFELERIATSPTFAAPASYQPNNPPTGMTHVPRLDMSLVWDGDKFVQLRDQLRAYALEAIAKSEGTEWPSPF